MTEDDYAHVSTTATPTTKKTTSKSRRTTSHDDSRRRRHRRHVIYLALSVGCVTLGVSLVVAFTIIFVVPRISRRAAGITLCTVDDIRMTTTAHPQPPLDPPPLKGATGENGESAGSTSHESRNKGPGMSGGWDRRQGSRLWKKRSLETGDDAVREGRKRDSSTTGSEKQMGWESGEVTEEAREENWERGEDVQCIEIHVVYTLLNGTRQRGLLFRPLNDQWRDATRQSLALDPTADELFHSQCFCRHCDVNIISLPQPRHPPQLKQKQQNQEQPLQPNLPEQQHDGLQLRQQQQQPQQQPVPISLLTSSRRPRINLMSSSSISAIQFLHDSDNQIIRHGDVIRCVFPGQSTSSKVIDDVTTSGHRRRVPARSRHRGSAGSSGGGGSDVLFLLNVMVWPTLLFVGGFLALFFVCIHLAQDRLTTEGGRGIRNRGGSGSGGGAESTRLRSKRTDRRQGEEEREIDRGGNYSVIVEQGST